MPNPPPKPQRLRVLTRETAQARSVNQPSPSPPNSNSPNASPEADATYSSIPKPKRTRPPFFSSLLTTLRARFAALPPPIRRTARVLRYVAPLVPIGMFFSEHVMQVVWVRGASMAPFLNENYETTHTRSDMVLVSMWPGALGWSWWAKAAEKEREKEKEGQGLRRRRMMERGMVVTFRSPANPSHIAVKRIIGLPGDRVFARHPYAKDSQIVPFNHVWLEGDADDPRKSLDSNTYGPVSMSLVTGRVVAVLRPRFRWLDWADWENGVFDNGGEKPVEGYRRGVRERVVKEAVDLEEGPVVA